MIFQCSADIREWNTVGNCKIHRIPIPDKAFALAFEALQYTVSLVDQHAQKRHGIRPAWKSKYSLGQDSTSLDSYMSRIGDIECRFDVLVTPKYIPCPICGNGKLLSIASEVYFCLETQCDFYFDAGFESIPKDFSWCDAFPSVDIPFPKKRS